MKTLVVNSTVPAEASVPSARCKGIGFGSILNGKARARAKETSIKAWPLAPVSIKAGQEKLRPCEFIFALIVRDLFCSTFPDNDVDRITNANANVPPVCPRLRLRPGTPLLTDCLDRPSRPHRWDFLYSPSR
jgi:hypothetical protein